MSRLNGKVAVITGGNSGIGYAAAQDFKAEGATVYITGRNAERVQNAAAELGVDGIVADVSNVQHIDEMVSKITAKHQKIDVLFINAGVFFPTPLGQIDENLFDQNMDINFKGAVFTLEKFLPYLSEGASVINLSSINAKSGMPNALAYSASKAAMNAFTRTAAIELAPRNIRVNSVNPGPVTTGIFGKTGMDEETLTGLATALQNRVPIKKFGTPESIAKLVTFLASDEAWYITGGDYDIDGGMIINPILSN